MVNVWGEIFRVYCWIFTVFNYGFGSQSSAWTETFTVSLLRHKGFIQPQQSLLYTPGWSNSCLGNMCLQVNMLLSLLMLLVICKVLTSYSIWQLHQKCQDLQVSVVGGLLTFSIETFTSLIVDVSTKKCIFHKNWLQLFSWLTINRVHNVWNAQNISAQNPFSLKFWRKLLWFCKRVGVFCGLLVVDSVWLMAVSEVCFCVTATLHTGTFVLQRSNNNLMISCFFVFCGKHKWEHCSAALVSLRECSGDLRGQQGGLTHWSTQISISAALPLSIDHNYNAGNKDLLYTSLKHLFRQVKSLY